MIAEADRRALVTAAAMMAVVLTLATRLALGARFRPALALRPLGTLLARFGMAPFAMMLARLTVFARFLVLAGLVMLSRLVLLAGLPRLAMLSRLARFPRLAMLSRLVASRPVGARPVTGRAGGPSATTTAATAATVGFLEGNRLHAGDLDPWDGRTDQLLDRIDQAAFVG